MYFIMKPSKSALACDIALAPALQAVRNMSHAVHQHCAPCPELLSAADASERPEDSSQAQTTTDEADLPSQTWPSLSPQEAQLLGDAGLWRSISALLASPDVRNSRREST